MSTQTMSISKAGLSLIQRYEGFRAEPARLPDGRYVVGHGHVRSSPPALPFTAADAAQALLDDLAPIEAMLNHLALAPLSQNQFDALVSFVFSIGQDAFKRSDILRNLNAGQPIAAACAMDAWRKSTALGEAQVIDILVRRRAAEKALFLDIDTIPAGPSVFLRSGLDHAQAVLAAAPIAAAPSLDAPATEHFALAQDNADEAEKLAEILESEPQTAALLRAGDAANDRDDRTFDDVLELTNALTQSGPVDTLGPPANDHGGVNAPLAMPPSGARAATRRPVAAPTDGMESRAFVLLAVAGLALIAMGAWMLFSNQQDNQVWFMVLAAPGVVVTAMAGYALAKAQTKRPSQQLPAEALAG
jgi:lysozyme